MDRLERATYWRGHVEAWRQINLTQIAYCAGQGLNPKAFYRWRRRLKTERMAGGERLTLLPVRVRPAQAVGVTGATGAMGEHLGADGIRLRSPRRTSGAYGAIRYAIAPYGLKRKMPPAEDGNDDFAGQ